MNKKLLFALLSGASILLFIALNSKTGYFGSDDPVKRVTFSRDIFHLFLFLLFLTAVFIRTSLIRVFKKHFSAESHPLNLSFFRIVVFSTILKAIPAFESVFFSGLSKDLLYPPPGLEKVAHILPLNPEIALIVKNVLTISTLLAVVGFCTRITAPIAVVSAVYYLGIPQLFGKVNHYHFLIWFSAILAVSPCSDVFSVDAVLRGFRQIKKGAIITPAPSREYGLPIRFIFVLFGILYFFPGLWKWYICGIDWIMTDNLKHLMYNKWYELDEWFPFFRIDQYPVLCYIGAAMTIFFEMFFIFFIFVDRWRYLAIFNGLFFHNMNWLFMNISFFNFTNMLRCIL